MIGWSYLDKRAAAVAALRDYTAMKNILAATPQAVKEAYGEIHGATRAPAGDRGWAPERQFEETHYTTKALAREQGWASECKDEEVHCTPKGLASDQGRAPEHKSGKVHGTAQVLHLQSGAEQMAGPPGKIDVLRQRYKRAREFMDWFAPAWGYLSETEQLVLREFYMGDSLRSGATARLQVKLGYSERYVDKIRSRSLGKLAKMLYGG